MAGHELKWDDIIEDDGRGPNIILPEGDYPFEVIDYTKTRSKGGKVPPCAMANVQLEIDGGELGSTVVYENFLLHSDYEWKLSQFFVSIGMKRKGERLKMNWDGARHKKGRAHLIIETWTGDDGKMRTKNKIDYFLDYDEEKADTSKEFTEIKEPDPDNPFRSDKLDDDGRLPF